MPDIFSFQDEPSFAALCTCIAIMKEIGDYSCDRLSRYLGVDSNLQDLKSSVFDNGKSWGLLLEKSDRSEFHPRHEDLKYFLNEDSFENGRLKRIIVYPDEVAETFRSRGVELVVVRDWLLGQAFSGKKKAIDLLHADHWELSNNAGLTQARLMAKCQLSFFATHDIVDHLLGAHIDVFRSYLPFYKSTFDSLYQHTVADPCNNAKLIISYLVGMLLDDLAQPYWYGSQGHIGLVNLAIKSLEELGETKQFNEVNCQLPSKTFNAVISQVRKKENDFRQVQRTYLQFKEGLVG